MKRPRFLLLQARNPGDPAEAHEQEAFRDVLGVEGDALRPWSLLAGPPPRKVLDEVACVLVGGSGEYGIGDAPDHLWLGEFISFMGELADEGFPMFASCFGFQALVAARGGRVETDKSRAEVGTFELHVTEEGREDPLFGPLHPRFFAQLGHKDHVVEFPADMVHLAGSARSPYQALRIPGKPVYATQFHPELSMRRNRERFLGYLEAYSQPDMPDTVDDVLAAFRETKAASALLRRYAHEVLPAYL
ncbi:MAG: type 1 glutamine amidotransferase [Planctomycetota bacterium]|nr:MAG: type 1 glutamine amidotransferase [Planctomycetota bacterium]